MNNKRISRFLILLAASVVLFSDCQRVLAQAPSQKTGQPTAIGIPIDRKALVGEIVRAPIANPGSLAATYPMSRRAAWLDGTRQSLAEPTVTTAIRVEKKSWWSRNWPWIVIPSGVAAGIGGARGMCPPRRTYLGPPAGATAP